MPDLTATLLWINAIGTGLMAGVYFAFSTFIMAALKRTPGTGGAAAMQSINSVILGSAFMPMFFGTSLVSLALAFLAVLDWQGPASGLALAAGAIYVAGMFGVTALRNVPLNNELDRADLTQPEGLATWQSYLTDWTRWNHVRTVASTVAALLSIAALLARAG